MSKDNCTSNNREVVKKQIMAIRDSGRANMFDRNAVQVLANERDFFELVCFIEEEPDRYSEFIISGNVKLLPK